jgi:IS605 OrfB family transposase
VKSLTGLLNQQARKVNLVWNFCNDRQKDALRFNRRWHTGFDLINLTTGCSKELGLHSGTINEVCQQYVKSRKPIPAPNFYREAEPALAIAQRAHKKRRVQAIHAQVSNRRHDFLHKLSTRLVREFDHIVVGNVNAAGLAKTSMAKSVLDAGWSTLRTQLAYKARLFIMHGTMFEVVDERFTTQICSYCENPIQDRSPRGEPRGIADLGIREWRCCDCGAVHDRDLNAAINILRRGRATLVAGISVL